MERTFHEFVDSLSAIDFRKYTQKKIISCGNNRTGLYQTLQLKWKHTPPKAKVLPYDGHRMIPEYFYASGK